MESQPKNGESSLRHGICLTTWTDRLVPILFLSIILGALAVGLWLRQDTEAARWDKERREVRIKEVSNGYIISYGVTNNPYPIREGVETDPLEVGLKVKDYLKKPLPLPDWGK